MSDMPGFNFALPRLMARLLGKNAHRTETNWLEANIVGTLQHLIVYLFACQWLLAGLGAWQKLLLALPLALLVWGFWVILFYVNFRIIMALHYLRIWRERPNNRAQSVLLGLITTLLAVLLVRNGACTAVLGYAWLAAVCSNLAAAALLSLSHVGDSPNQ